MAIAFFHKYFSSETEARAEIERAGLWPLQKDIPAEQNQSHWHAYDAHVYVLDGVVQLTDSATGITHTCDKGTKIVVPARTLHAEAHDGYRALLGLSVDPSQLRQPTQLPPEQLND